MNKSYTLVLTLLMLLQLWTPSPARAAGATYYVSPNGNNTYPGTQSQPWRTIQKAADTAVAGDTVYVRKGTYNEKVIVKNSGAPGAFITFSAYPGEKPVVDVRGIAILNYFEGGFTISNKSYVQVIGFKVANSPQGFGIVCYQSDNCVIKNNTTYNTYMSGIAVRSSTNVTVDGNDVSLANNDGEQEMITISGSSFVTVTNNRVHDGGPGTNGGEGINVKNGSHDVLVQNNQVYNLPRIGIYVDAQNLHTYNVTVDRNVVHHSGRSGIAIASERGGELNNITISNNLIYQNGRTGMVVGAWSEGYSHPIHHVYIVNNTIYQNGISTDLWGGGISVENGDFSNIYIRNNIISENVRYTIELLESPLQVVITHNLIDGFRGDTTETRGINYVEADPLFINASALDFSLLAASPAINAGTALNAPDHDFLGVPRPSGAAWDIGAYESTGSTPPPTSSAIFSDDFETQFIGWTKSGNITWYTGTPVIGSYSLRLAGNGYILRTIPTLGYTNITLTINLGANSYEGLEQLRVLWWDGAYWQLLTSIKNNSVNENNSLNRLEFLLPAKAANRTDFKIRIQQVNADLNDQGFIDNIVLTGTPK